MNGDDPPDRSRRAILTASASAGAVGALATLPGSASAATDDSGLFERRCPDATIEPSHGHCEAATMAGCADDHPKTIALREAVSDVLDRRYPSVGRLLDDDFLPYFDTFDRAEDGWSHWLSPEYIGDDAVVDPERPESVLVDNQTWRPIGVMFIATRNDEPIDPPPAVYGENEPDDDRCSPWHYHAGVPGRKAWWYYQNLHAEDGDRSLRLPCRTPCMMHVWTVDHPEGVYAHGGPPAEYRDQEPAEEAGFDTDAEPGEDHLGWDALPDAYLPDVLPDELDWP